MTSPIVEEVFIDLVRQDEEVMPAGKFSQRL